MKTRITLLAISLVLSLNAQNFQGIAIYKTSSKSSISFGGEKSSMSDKMKEDLQKRFQKMNQKTFTLKFDKTTSIYKENEKLNAPLPQGGHKIISIGGANNDILFKNLKTKTIVNQTDIMSKPFLIKDKLEEIDWQLTSETKNIGNYTCYKATFSKQVEKHNISLNTGKVKEVKEMVTKVTTAWYTPQIPISNGPKEYQGLPGLILEINDGHTTIVCTEIIINPTEKIEIIKPKKGKVVTREKFNKISKQKTEEMMERYRSKDGKSIEINFGG